MTNAWEYMFQAKERETPIEARIAGVSYADNAPVWDLTFPALGLACADLRGLCPASEAGVDAPLMPRLTGRDTLVVVKGLDRENGLVACSRREAEVKARDRLNVKEGQTVECSVLAVLPRDPEAGKPARLLVDLDGVWLEIPRSRAAYRQAVPLRQQYRPGDAVKARVQAVGADGLPVLSVRDALPDPWERADFRRGQFLACTVAGVRNGIVFLEPDLAPGMIGIAPVPLAGEVEPGDRVTCAVATFDRGNRKLRLRLRGW